MKSRCGRPSGTPQRRKRISRVPLVWPVAKKKSLQSEAGDSMAKAVTYQGLSVEEYTTILSAAQKDPAVRDKLLQRMK